MSLNTYCHACEVFFRELSAFGATRVDQGTYPAPKYVPFNQIQSLMDSAAGGCHFCSLLLAQMTEKAVQDMIEELAPDPQNVQCQMYMSVEGHYGRFKKFSSSEPPPAIIPAVPDNWGGTPRLQLVRARNGGPQNYEDLCDITVISDTSSEWGKCIFTPKPTSTSSSTTLECIRTWLFDCGKFHKDCRGRRQWTENLPRRLLYVGVPERVQLRECSELLPDPPEYVTLSHCWGKFAGAKLTDQDHNKFRNGVDLATLPRTFRDAVDLTRRIGKDYLWIDSLCIFQDSDQDWKEESPRMGGIYAGAWLNIAANSSWNSNGGMYQRRNPLCVMPCKIILNWSSLGWHQREVGLWPRGYKNDIVENAPLTTRAWCVQERLLAPRTVHFLAHKAVWECTSLHASETDLKGILESRQPLRDDRLRWAISPPSNPAAWLEQWYEAVEVYSRADLTYQTDKLVAISGLAYKLKKMWQGSHLQYWSGLWSYNLEWSLCWATTSPGKRPAHPLAPSWSWASIKAPIYHPRLPSHPEYLSRILSVRSPSTDSLAEITERSTLQIWGPMCPITARLHTDGTVSGLQLLEESLNMEYMQITLDEGVWPTQENGSSQQLFLLGISKSPPWDSAMVGLVLQLTGNNTGEYVRVGSWEMYDWDHEVEKVESAFAAVQLSPNSFEGQHMVNNMYMYTITLA